MAERGDLTSIVEVSLPAYTEVTYTPIGRIKPLPVTFQDIHYFLIERKRQDNDNSGSVLSYRTMDGAVAHFQAGDVQDIQLSQVSQHLMYGTAVVLASMKKGKYTVWICFQQGKPVHASCQCPIGLAQYCSHVGSLLFVISNYNISLSDEEVACTSKLSKWNVPRKMTMEPKPLKDLKFAKSKSNVNNDQVEKVSVLDFDPRHSSQRTLNVDHYLTKMMELPDILPNTGMGHLDIIPDRAPVAESEVTIATYQNPLEEKTKALIYKVNTSTAHLIIPIDPELAKYVEQHTREQRGSELWRELHRGRITSSLFGEVLHAGPRPLSLVHKILNGSNLDRYDSLPKAVKWGVQNESNAVDDYLLLQNAVTSLTVTKSGLALYPSHPFLGASSDGRVTDKSVEPTENQQGILEVKCPYSVNGQEVYGMEVCKITEMGAKEFCLEMIEDVPRLRRNHKYYAQVQGEMAMIGVPWCDFVVWTAAKENNCFIERVQFDVDFVSKMLPKLVEFFIQHILQDFEE